MEIRAKMSQKVQNQPDCQVEPPEGEYQEQPQLCYQCGKCSTGCPVADEMDLLPRQVIHLAGTTEEQKILDSKTIWICAGCYTCAVRCPNDIEITSVMDHFRKKSLTTRSKCAEPQVLKFHQTFLKNIARGGRLHEMRLMGEYNLKTAKPLYNMTLAPKMILTRGLKFLLPPKKIKGFKSWFKKIWK